MAYLILFFALAGVLGRFGANALALALCTAANTAVHRRTTFARRGEPSRRDLLLGGTAALSTSVAATSVALILTDWAGSVPSWLLAAVLTLANGAAALVRFLLLRGWMFRTARTPVPAVRSGPGGAGMSPPTLLTDVVPAPTLDGVALTERQTG